MKSRAAPRPYRQGARAEATEATGRRIAEAFLAAAGERWFDEITLDSVAREAGVTVQTVVRRFGGKEGLMEAAFRRMGDMVNDARSWTPGDIDAAVDTLVNDYERVGDLVWRLLAQEARHPILIPILDMGRREHRGWVAAVFAPQIAAAPEAARAALLDALVAAADVYVWKLFRRDMGRSPEAARALIAHLIRGVLAANPDALEEPR